MLPAVTRATNNAKVEKNNEHGEYIFPTPPFLIHRLSHEKKHGKKQKSELLRNIA